MAYRGTSPAGAIHTAARYKSCEKQFHPEMGRSLYLGSGVIKIGKPSIVTAMHELA